jgi:hypothetical protein
MNQQYNIDERLSYPISSIVIVPSSIEPMKEWRKNDARDDFIQGLQQSF